MKKILFLSIIIFLFSACINEKKITKYIIIEKDIPVILKNRQDSLSFALGRNIALKLDKELSDTLIVIDKIVFAEGIKSYFTKNDTVLADKYTKEIVNNYQSVTAVKRDILDTAGAFINGETGKKYEISNQKLQGIITLKSGLQYKVIKNGKGKNPMLSDKVTISYVGKLLNGKIFDSTNKRGDLLEIELNMLIDGLQEGIQQMREGAIYEFLLPPHLAYGKERAGTIPPNSTLIFEIKLLKIN